MLKGITMLVIISFLEKYVKKLNFYNHLEVHFQNMENNCIQVTDELYAFLVKVLPRDHLFEFFASDLKDTYFEILFPTDSPIRQFENKNIERLMFHVVPSEQRTCIRVEMKSKLGRHVISPSLGYEDGTKIFTSKEEVLDECIRLAWSPPSPPHELSLLDKTTGECVVCLNEGEVLKWPCYSSHVTCEACAIKIITRTFKCPICRAEP